MDKKLSAADVSGKIARYVTGYAHQTGLEWIGEVVVCGSPRVMFAAALAHRLMPHERIVGITRLEDHEGILRVELDPMLVSLQTICALMKGWEAVNETTLDLTLDLKSKGVYVHNTKEAAAALAQMLMQEGEQ